MCFIILWPDILNATILILMKRPVIILYLISYTTIPHDKLKSRLTNIIRNSFIFKNGNRRYKYLVLGHNEAYFVKEHSDS